MSLQRIDEMFRMLPQLEMERNREYTVLVNPRRDTPWLHVEWVLHMAASHEASRVYLDLRMDDTDDHPSMEDVGGEVSMPILFRIPDDWSRVEIRPTAEGPDLWPPDGVRHVAVRVPTEVMFRLGGKETGDVEELRKWAAELAASRGADFGFVVVAADPRVPARFVTEAVRVLREVSGAPVGLPTAAPPEAVRERIGLPYPD